LSPVARRTWIHLKLIVQPEDGVAPLLAAVKKARKSVEIAIFRLDRGDLEAALKAAVSGGVKVTALVASINRGGERNLREMEMRLLDAGIIVARSGSDLIRHHGKIMIVDQSVLHLLSFNYTHLDIDHSRGFGIVTKNAKWVQEAVKLLECDSTRKPYTAGLDSFVVSPANSRRVLGNFLKRARRQLLIYDPQISDKAMISILQSRAKAGVEIRIIGRVEGRVSLPVGKLTRMRLHTRTIIRDRRQAFIGSQSLRPIELDSRREVGLIIHEPKVLKRLIDIFEADWASAQRAGEPEAARAAPAETAKIETERAAKVLVQELHPVTVTVKKAVRKAVARGGEEVLKDKTVKNAVKKVVKKAVKEAVEEVVQNNKDT
jgi:phosphatidylserine/phosphatidylglycerophosphate/cardiolipin synthase-like enzyme